MNNSFNKPLTIKQVWSGALCTYEKTFPQVWPLSALVGGVLGLSLFLSVFFEVDLSQITPATMIFVVVSLVILAVKVYLATVILHRTQAIVEGQKKTLRDSMLFVRKKFLKIAAAMFLAYLVCSAIIAAFMFLIQEFSFIFLKQEFALIFPGMFLFLLFMMVQPLVLFDNAAILASLKKSLKLVWGNWWRTFMVIFPFLMLNYLVGMSAKFVSEVGYWYVGIASVLVITLIYPLFYASLFIQFQNLKARKILEKTSI